MPTAQTQPAPRKRIPLAALRSDPDAGKAVQRVMDRAELVNGLPVAAFNSSI